MITTTTWKPDTCGCTITYNFDTEHPENDVYNYQVIEKCEHHTDISDADLPMQIKSENTSKNLITADIKEKQGVDVDWSFDENRNLVINSDVPVEIPKLADIPVVNNTLDIPETISPDITV